MQQLDDFQQILRNALLINSISRVIKVNNTPLEGSSLLSFEGSNHFQGYQFAKDITQFSLKILRKKGNADITHVLNKESKRDRDSEIVIPENYKKTAWISYSLILPSFTSWKLLFCCPHFNLQSWCCTCDDSTWTLKSWPQQKVNEIFHHEKSVDHLYNISFERFSRHLFGGGDSLNHPPRNLIIPSGFVDHHFPPKKKRHLCHHLCHQDTNWIPLVGQGGSSKFKPRWFCDSFLYSKNPYSRPKLGPSNTNHGQFEFFGLLMSVFVWKQKKSTTGNFSTSPFPKGEATKSHHHQPWTLFAATVAGQDKANAGHHLDITPPPSPTQDASSSPPGLYHYIFRRPGIPI